MLIKVGEHKWLSNEGITGIRLHYVRNELGDLMYSVYYDAENKQALNGKELAMLLSWCRVVDAQRIVNPVEIEHAGTIGGGA